MKRVGALNIILCSYSFLLSIFYVPFFFSGATNTRWAFLAVTTPILILILERQSFTLLHLIGLSFCIFSLFSLLWTFNFYDSIDNLINLFIIAQIFVLGNRLNDLKPIFLGLGFGIAISSFYTFILNYEGGLFINRNILADAAILTIVGLIIYKLWWLIPLALPSALTGSRAVIIAALASLAAFVWNKNKFAKYGILILIIFVVVASIIFDYRIGSIIQRLELWKDIVNGFSLLGNGYGSLYSAYPYFSEAIDTLKERPRYAHNDLIQIVFELGICGYILAILFISILLRININEKYIIFTFIILSLFSFPFHMPVSAFIFSIVAGYMSRNRNSIFNYNNVS